MQSMYSSLFSAGLVQLWDADQSPVAPAFDDNTLTSFLSFDDSRTTRRPRHQQPRRRRSDDDDDFRTYVHDTAAAGSSSPSRSVSLYLAFVSPVSQPSLLLIRTSTTDDDDASRLSMDSVMTLPTRSGPRSRSGARGASSSKRHTVFSTTTDGSSSFFAFYPPSSSSDAPPLPTSAGLMRRRSLPSAKPAPAPNAVLPAAPSSSVTPLSYYHPESSSSSSSAMLGKNKGKSTTLAARAAKAKSHHASFVPSESSSGSSNSTISYRRSVAPTVSSSTFPTPTQSPARVAKGKGKATSTSTSSLPLPLPLGVINGNGDEASRSSSPWTLPHIQTSGFDFELSGPGSGFEAGLFPPLPASEYSSSPSAVTSSAASIMSAAELDLPPPSMSSSSASIHSSHSVHSARSIHSAHSSHSMQSEQSMQSMLESTSSTSTVTLDDLADSLLDDLDLGLSGVQVGSGSGHLSMGLSVRPSMMLGEQMMGAHHQGVDSTEDVGVDMNMDDLEMDMDMDLMGLEDGLQSFRVSFDVEDLALAGFGSGFGATSVRAQPRGERTRARDSGASFFDEEDDVLGEMPMREHGGERHPFPMSVRGSLDEGSDAHIPLASPNPALQGLEAVKPTNLTPSQLVRLSSVPSPGPLSTTNPAPSSPLSPHSSTSTATQSQIALARSLTTRTARTIASVSTGYKRTKRSDALAQLEGRVFAGGYQFAPPHLKSQTKSKAYKLNKPSPIRETGATGKTTGTEGSGGSGESGESGSTIDSASSFMPGSLGAESLLSFDTASTLDGSGGSGSGSSGLKAGSSGPRPTSRSVHDQRERMRAHGDKRESTAVLGMAWRSSPALATSPTLLQHPHLHTPATPNNFLRTPSQQMHFRSYSNPNTPASPPPQSATAHAHAYAQHAYSHSSSALALPPSSFLSDSVTSNSYLMAPSLSTPVSPTNPPSPCLSSKTKSKPSRAPTPTRSNPSGGKLSVVSHASSFGCAGMHWSDTGFVSFIDSDEDDDPRHGIPRRRGGPVKNVGASKAARVMGENVKDVTAVVERVSLENAQRASSFEREREQRGPSFDRAFEMPVGSRSRADAGKGKGTRHGANFIDLR